MGQFGMQLPGGRARRTASPNIYSALMFVAVVGLLVACFFVYRAAASVGPKGNAYAFQNEKSIELPDQLGQPTPAPRASTPAPPAGRGKK
jgi:hypothetical protein